MLADPVERDVGDVQLLSSCISMRVLPLMPISDSTNSPALPPIALAAATKARRFFNRGAQRGNSST